ncbi:hypothetical protein XENORESO_016898 [Xenotaenia resolanae]|uniref:Uncharacterized protein n=1 Tax=Xenotaenia resolanae TaxID=208358 RepID=A0ABV0WG07_9TELE
MQPVVHLRQQSCEGDWVGGDWYFLNRTLESQACHYASLLRLHRVTCQAPVAYKQTVRRSLMTSKNILTLEGMKGTACLGTVMFCNPGKWRHVEISVENV